MVKKTNKEISYLAYIEFLMMQKRAVIAIGSQYNLSSMQTITLLFLDQARPMHYISSIFSCDASNVTGIVDGLQQKGLVERYEDEKDRRIRMVRTNSEGERLREILMQKLVDDSNSIFSKLDDSEIKSFFAIIRKVAAN